MINLYTEIIKLYVINGGSINYEIIDNQEIQKIFKKNEKLIKNLLKK